MITKVTVTGADDKTNPNDLIELAKKYPFVEFGILLSKRQEGCKRFPSRDWINNFESLTQKFYLDNNKIIQCAGHLCGSWVTQLLVGNMSEVGEVINNWGVNVFEPRNGLFQRWQINTHGAKHDFNSWFITVTKELNQRGQFIIFQYDDKNTEMIDTCRQFNSYNLSALFDLSHGAGVLPVYWPKPPVGLSVGYAGGLSPLNVVEQINKILSVAGKSDFWIDAETHLRSNIDDTFDIDKVDMFLKLSEPYVNKNIYNI
jgi:hypothetical protein